MLWDLDIGQLFCNDILAILLLYLYLILAIGFTRTQPSIIVIEFEILLEIRLLIERIRCIKAPSGWNVTHVHTGLLATRLVLAFILTVWIRIDTLEVVLTLILLHLNLIFHSFRLDLLLVLALDFFIIRYIHCDTATGDTAIIFLIFCLPFALIIQVVVVVSSCLFAKLRLHQCQLVLLFTLIRLQISVDLYLLLATFHFVRILSVLSNWLHIIQFLFILWEMNFNFWIGAVVNSHDGLVLIANHLLLYLLGYLGVRLVVKILRYDIAIIYLIWIALEYLLIIWLRLQLPIWLQMSVALAMSLRS